MRPQSPCKDCPRCVRTILVGIYDRSCHSDLCPFGWSEWHKKDQEELAKLTAIKAADVDFIASKVNTVRHSKNKAKRNR